LTENGRLIPELAELAQRKAAMGANLMRMEDFLKELNLPDFATIAVKVRSPVS
jgi:hypothetical protein